MGNAGVRAVGHAVGVGGEIPEPSGPLRPVGTQHTRVPGACVVRVLYPCEAASGGAAATRGYTREVVVRNAPLVFKNVRNTRHYMREGARVRAPPAPLARYPVVLFSHGLKGSADVYSKIASDLASHGFVVFCLEHEDGSASFAMREGESKPVPERKAPKELDTSVRANVVQFRAPFIEHRKKEVAKVLEWLRIKAGESASGDSELARVLALCDVSRLYCGGHSFGACSSVMVAADPTLRPAFRAAFLLDLWPEPLPDEVLDAGVQLPVLSVASEHFADLPMSEHSSRLLSNSTACHSLYATASIHEDFSDFPFLLRPATMRRFVNKRATGPSPETQTATVDALVAHLAAHGGAGAGEAMPELLARHCRLLPFPKQPPPSAPLPATPAGP